MTTRANMLRDVADITEERGKTYGPPGEHFARTIGAINSILGHKMKEPFTPSDWATMMMIDKLARDQHVPKADNLHDVAGYAACVFEIRHEGEVQVQPVQPVQPDNPAPPVDMEAERARQKEDMHKERDRHAAAMYARARAYESNAVREALDPNSLPEGGIEC